MGIRRGMMRWRALAAAVAAASAIAALAGCSSSASAPAAADGSSGGGAASKGQLKVGLILNGALDDGGWNTTWGNAAHYLQARVPGTKVTLVPNIVSGTQAQNTARALATQGYNLIVLTGGYSDSTVASVAHDFPDTWFANEAGTEVAPNMIPFSVAIEQGRYLDGIVAGSVTKNGKMGEVGGFPIPIEVRTLDAFQQGVRSVNPKATTKVLWVNSYYDPTGERQAAQALASSGADTLVMDSNTPAVPSVARQQNLNLIGYGISAAHEAPQQWLSAFTFNWGPYLVAWANGIHHGTLKAKLYYWGLKQGVIGQTPLGPRVPARVKSLIARAKAQIIAGKLNVFAGSAVAADARTETQLNACCTKFVAGVTGSLPSH